MNGLRTPTARGVGHSSSVRRSLGRKNALHVEVLFAHGTSASVLSAILYFPSTEKASNTFPGMPPKRG